VLDDIGLWSILDYLQFFRRNPFLSRTNLIAWVRFGQLTLKELNTWYNAGHIDTDAVDEYLDKEYKAMLR